MILPPAPHGTSLLQDELIVKSIIGAIASCFLKPSHIKFISNHKSLIIFCGLIMLWPNWQDFPLQYIFFKYSVNQVKKKPIPTTTMWICRKWVYTWHQNDSACPARLLPYSRKHWSYFLDNPHSEHCFNGSVHVLLKLSPKLWAYFMKKPLPNSLSKRA